MITGATPHGQGQETSFAQIAADRLGVPIEDVVVLRGDTASAHFGRDTYGSRATALGGTAIVMSIDKMVFMSPNQVQVLFTMQVVPVTRGSQKHQEQAIAQVLSQDNKLLVCQYLLRSAGSY